MANFYEYIKWRGDLEFDRDPFNPVDNIIFSALSYLPMEGIVPGPDESGSVSVEEAGKLSAEKHRNYLSARFNIEITITGALGVINAIKDVPRYKDCRLFGFIDNTDFQHDIQFSAYCASLDMGDVGNALLVVFRGTDLRLAGWKEDMDMSFSDAIPAQEEAVAYLNKMAALYPGPLIVAGHSKGGNLAIYASAFCAEAIQSRIGAIYCNDGPGFHQSVIESPGYRAICGRIQSFIPQSSLVGLLFCHSETQIVVKSKAGGLLQHDMASWEVKGNRFVGAELTQQSRFTSKVIHEWLDQIDEGQRAQFIETIYHVITAGNARSIADFSMDFGNKAAGMINAVKNMDGKTKKLISKIIGGLIKTTGKNLKKNLIEEGALLTDRLTRARNDLMPGKD